MTGANVTAEIHEDNLDLDRDGNWNVVCMGKSIGNQDSIPASGIAEMLNAGRNCQPSIIRISDRGRAR